MAESDEKSGRKSRSEEQIDDRFTRPPAEGGREQVEQTLKEGKRHPSERDKDQAELEEELDRGLKDTFPASDPPSATQIVTPGKPPKRDRE